MRVRVSAITPAVRVAEEEDYMRVHVRCDHSGRTEEDGRARAIIESGTWVVAIDGAVCTAGDLTGAIINGGNNTVVEGGAHCAT